MPHNYVLITVPVLITPLSCASHVTKHRGGVFVMASNSVNVQAISDAVAPHRSPSTNSTESTAAASCHATPAGKPGHGEDRSVHSKFVGASA